MIKVKILKKVKSGTGSGFTNGSGGSGSGNGSGNGYVNEAAHATEADHAKEADKAKEADHAKEADKAKEADHATSAHTLDDDTPVLDWFLSKKKADRTPFPLNVGGKLTPEDVIGSLEFLSGLWGGFGWQIDQKGNAELESLKVRSFMEIMELIVNRMSAIEGDQLFTEGDTIESVQENTDGTYTLKLREKWEGYKTAQIENNVLRGIYNNITNSISGEGTTTIHGATYYTCWMLVLSVDAANNTLRVSTYADTEVPAGRNFAPCEMMNIARWGNAGSSENPKYKQRQTTFLISSTEGRILKYINVTKPIIDKGNVAISIGDVPEFLIGINKDIKEGDQVIYTQKNISEQNIRVDWMGRPVATEVFRGDWDPSATYYDGSELVEQSIAGACYERSIVRMYGCLWLCNSNHTTKAPMFGGTAWTFHEGIDVMELEFDTTQDSVWADNPEITLGVACRIGNHDFTDSGLIRYDWSRQSWHGDVEAVDSDTMWNSNHKNQSPSINLGLDDFNYSFGNPPSRLIITVTATLLDAEGNPAVDSTGEKYIRKIGFDLSQE